MESRTTVALCLLDLLKNGKHSDVVFIVGKETKERIVSHQFLLMTRSPVFETMFAERWKVTTSEIAIPDAEPAPFRMFLQYIYGDVFTTKIDEAIEILYLAHKYQVLPLVEQCENLLKTEMKLKNVIPIYQAARLYDLSALKKQAGELMANQFSALINDSSFELVDEETLLEFLPRNYLLVHELPLFDALLRWSHAQLGTKTPSPADQRRVLERILPHVRFPLIKVQDFATEIVPKNILTPAETIALFTYMTSGTKVSSGLKSKLGFVLHPRLPDLEYKVEWYETNETDCNLTADNFTLVTNQTDVTEFSIMWTNELLLSPGCNRTAYISSIKLRGPNYSRIQNMHGNSLLGWQVTVKLEKLDHEFSAAVALTCSSYAPRSRVGKFTIFGDKNTVLHFNPPFELQEESNYKISVSFSDSVYLPKPEILDSKTLDYFTSTRKKSVCFIEDIDINAVSKLCQHDLLVFPNFSASSDIRANDNDLNENSDRLNKRQKRKRQENQYQSQLHLPKQYSSHCIRSIKLKVQNY